MFVPSPYRPPDASWLVETLRANPLALMVTNGGADESPHATHLPIIPGPRFPECCPEGLAGAPLLGHMNRANPHWAALSDRTTALLVFTGPHGYVSPTAYQKSPAAPTWNFTSVHVQGSLRKIESEEETLDVVRATVRTFEAEFGDGWDMSGSVDYFRNILPGVGAFRFTVQHAEGMFKLSQEQEPAVRERVRQWFAGSHSTGHSDDISRLMNRLDPPNCRADP